MFEDPDIYMDDMLGTLAIEKIRYEHTGTSIGVPLDVDFFLEIYYDALENVAPSVSAETNYYDGYIQKFFFSGMEEFYRLCREYGRKNQVSFKNN